MLHLPLPIEESSSLALCFDNATGLPGVVWPNPVIITSSSFSSAAYIGADGLSVVLAGLDGLSSVRTGLVGLLAWLVVSTSTCSTKSHDLAVGDHQE